MCEIAIVDPSNYTPKQLISLGSKIYKRNNDGFGVVAVNQEGDRLSYDVYKRETPDWYAMFQFFDWNMTADRFVIHGRLATCGGVGYDQSHPIQLDCPETDIDMVIHNGTVSRDSSHRRRMKREGHSFTTEVDTEVIPHAHGEVPADPHDASVPTGLSGSLNYVLFGRERMAFHNDRSYITSEDFRAYKTGRAGDDFDGSLSNEWVVMEADGTTECAEGTGTTTTYSRGHGFGVPRTSSTTVISRKDDDGEDDKGKAVDTDGDGKTHGDEYDRDYWDYKEKYGNERACEVIAEESDMSEEELIENAANIVGSEDMRDADSFDEVVEMFAGGVR